MVKTVLSHYPETALSLKIKA